VEAKAGDPPKAGRVARGMIKGEKHTVRLFIVFDNESELVPTRLKIKPYNRMVC